MSKRNWFWYVVILSALFLASCGAQQLDDSGEASSIQEGAARVDGGNNEPPGNQEEDTSPPKEPNIIINEDADITNSIIVQLTLSAKDEHGVSAYFANEENNKPTPEQGGWVTLTPAKEYNDVVDFTLSEEEGVKTVFVWFKDSAGNVSNNSVDTITYSVEVVSTSDTTAPINPSVVINSGDDETDSTGVTLSISASDDQGVVAYYVSESSSTPLGTDSGWMTLNPATDVSADVDFELSGSDGEKTVYVWFKDDAGNISVSTSDSITLNTGDSTAPENPSVTINSGDTETTSTTVTLSLSATDDVGVVGYFASETSSTPASNAEGWGEVTSTASYSATVSFSLSSGAEEKTVYVWFKDAAGNVSASASASITLTNTDTTAPSDPSLSINSDDASTTSTVVTLSLSATDDTGVTAYYASSASTMPNSTDSGWTAVSSTTSFSADVSFTLSGESAVGDFTKTVYVWFKDDAGNVSSVATDSITLAVSDTTAPANASITINNGDTSTDTTSVTLSLSSTDDVGVSAYYASESSTTPNSTDSGWTAVTSATNYSADVSFTLSSSDGTKTVYVWFKDDAGNVSTGVNDSIEYAAATGGTIIPTDGLVAYYPFDGTADDMSGNGNHGTAMNGVALTTDRFGNANSAYSFDGVDDYIEVPYHSSLNLMGTQSWTISLWVQLNSFGSDYSHLIGNRGSSSYSWTTAICIQNSGTCGKKPYMFVRGNISPGVYSNTQLSAANWYHLIFIRDSSSNIGTVFLNGILDSNKVSLPANITDYTSNVVIGGLPSQYYLNGLIDDIRIYNRALTEAEVTALYNESPFKLPDTGQTTSYTTTFGEDADYPRNPMSFTDNADGTVTDDNTGLMWQQDDDNVTRTWADAGTYCTNLSLGGHTDWRLPNRRELMRISDYGTFSPAIDATAFPGTNSSDYWSSTTDAGDTTSAWYVNINLGHVGSYGKTDSLYVRCVRGDEQIQTSFTDNGDGTVTDGNTGLMWQQQDDNSTRTWEAAITYCEGLSIAGFSDWRLPNIKELESIVDDSVNSPSIDATAFPNTDSSFYWSSSTLASWTTRAWYVDFLSSHVSSYFKTSSYNARCVRNIIPTNMVYLPATTFDMGSTTGQADEAPVHSVTLSSFYLDKYEVTVDQYAECVNAGICATPRTETYDNWGVTGRGNHPINGVDWQDATDYCTYVGKRLPTEAEWERAASWKDGMKYEYPNGNNSIDCTDAVLRESGSWSSNGGCGTVSTWDVGSKTQEINGTFDMAGNVWEWVSDWYGSYDSAAQTDPTGPASGSSRVIRGGGWYDYAYRLRGASRGGYAPTSRDFNIGFRCAMDAP